MKKQFEITDKESFIILYATGFALLSPLIHIIFMQAFMELGLSGSYGFYLISGLGWLAMVGALIVLIRMMRKHGGKNGL